MALKKFSFKTNHSHQKQRLDQVLATTLPNLIKQPVSKGKIRKLIVAGAVYLNGRRVRIASKELLSNVLLDVFIDLQKLNSDSKSRDLPFEMTDARVLFEDDYIIVVNKPPGLPTQPTLDEARDNLFSAVKKFLQKRAGKSAPAPYLGLHHRLDRDTSGVILFTKLLEANKGIAEIFTQHLAQKTYQALTVFPEHGKVKESWEIKNYLGRLKDAGKKGKFGSVRSGGDFADTQFKLLNKFSGGLWVEAKPLTGRTHQIRIHLSEDGMPILGDTTYGGPTQVGQITIPRLMLHAAGLTFPHPIHENKVSVQSPLPEDFSQCLKALQKGFPNF